MNKRQFLKSLHEEYTRLGCTENGVGVVAIRKIPKGIDPFKNGDIRGDVLKISERELEECDAPEEAKTLVRDFCALQDGILYAPDYGMDGLPKSYYLNHSKKPNMETRDEGESFVTKRSIRKGEELTVDYDTFHEARHFRRR